MTGTSLPADEAAGTLAELDAQLQALRRRREGLPAAVAAWAERHRPVPVGEWT